MAEIFVSATWRIELTTLALMALTTYHTEVECSITTPNPSIKK